MPMRMYMIGYVSALVRALGPAKISSFKLLKAQIIINSDNDTSQAEEYKNISNYTPVFYKKNILGKKVN